MKHFTSADDVADIDALVQTALAHKAAPLANQALGKGKRIGLLFLNPSLRTRLSTQVAASNLGMEAIVFNIGNEGWQIELEEHAIMNGSTVEHIKDAAPVLGSYFDILCIRTFPQLQDREQDYSDLFMEQLKKYAGVPIVSLESTTLHPLQSLTDILTIQETFKEPRAPKIVLSWAPHIKPLPQCVANSFAQWVNRWGKADFVIAHPEGYELAEQFTGGARIMHDQQQALRDADYLYVKNWSSYTDYGKLNLPEEDWMINKDKLALTNNARVMHCLPVRRNIELSEEVLDSTNSIITRQAANRTWAAQAVLSSILKQPYL